MLATFNVNPCQSVYSIESGRVGLSQQHLAFLKYLDLKSLDLGVVGCSGSIAMPVNVRLG
jgi:hypothetical protein